MGPAAPASGWHTTSATHSGSSARGCSRQRRLYGEPRAKKLGLEDGYSYTPDEYVAWLEALGPRLSWAGTFDYCCAGATDRQVIRERQAQTTEMAWLFWQRYQQTGAVFVPTIQGRLPDDYRQHVWELRPLIEEMASTLSKQDG